MKVIFPLVEAKEAEVCIREARLKITNKYPMESTVRFKELRMIMRSQNSNRTV